jgi:hypothetical protein
LIEPSDEGIENLKLLLLFFENMSGLKINFDKSEVLVMGGYGTGAAQDCVDAQLQTGPLPDEVFGSPSERQAFEGFGQRLPPLEGGSQG